MKGANAGCLRDHYAQDAVLRHFLSSPQKVKKINREVSDTGESTLQCSDRYW